jgi:hypothetical protein
MSRDGYSLFRLLETISILEQRNRVRDASRFLRFWFIVITPAGFKVRSGSLVHGDSDSGWSCLTLEVVGTFALSDRPRVENMARVGNGRSFFQDVAIIQSKCDGCKGPRF